MPLTLVDNNSQLKFNKWISVSVIIIGYPHCIYTTIYDYKANQVISPFLTHLQITITLGFPKRKLLLLNIFSFDLAEVLSDTVHRLFPQRQCCKHTV